MARRRQRPGTGSALRFVRQRTVNVEWPDVRRVMGDIGCAVVGAVATRLYMPERTTFDLDLAIASADAKAARRAVRSAGWTHEGDLTIGGSSWLTLDGVSVDLIEGSEEWWPGAIAEAQLNLDLQGLPILPLRYLALMKFRSGRTQDVADVTRMLGQADPVQLEAIRALFKSEEPGGLEDLESLIELGQLEMRR